MDYECENEEVYDTDMELVTLVQANPRIWDKTQKGYKNSPEKLMAFTTIGNALTVRLNGDHCQHRWNALRNMYARWRRNLTKTPSGAGSQEIKELPPIFHAMHRFLAGVYAPRKTISSVKRNLDKSSSCSNNWTTEVLDPVVVEQSTPSPAETSTSSSQDHTDISPRAARSQCSSSGGIYETGKRKAPMPDPFFFNNKKEKLHAQTALRESAESIKCLAEKMTKTVDHEEDDRTKEESAMVTVLLYAIRRIPIHNRTRAMCALFETIKNFEDVN